MQHSIKDECSLKVSKKDECPKIALANYYDICEMLVLVSKVEEH